MVKITSPDVVEADMKKKQAAKERAILKAQDEALKEFMEESGEPVPANVPGRGPVFDPSNITGSFADEMARLMLEAARKG